MCLKKLILIVMILTFSCDAFSADWYISPSGNDGNNGQTTGTAIATFSHAYTIMSPGDTLMLMDGTYTQQLYPPVALSGAAGTPTIFRAVNPGSVIIAPTSYPTEEAALYVYSSSILGTSHHFTFIGLHVRGHGDTYALRINSRDNMAEAEITHDIVVQQCGAFGRGMDSNVTVFEVSNAKTILIEDGYAYGFGRKAFEAFGCRAITVRRFVARYDWWEGDNYITTDPRNCFTAYNTIDSVFENILAFDAGPHPTAVNPDRSGITASGNLTDVNPISGTSNCIYAGCIVFNNEPPSGIHNGFMINGGSGENTTNLTIKDTIILDQTSYGFIVLNNVDGVYFDHCTSWSNGLSGWYVNDGASVQNVFIDQSYAHNNGRYGWYGSGTVTNSTATGNVNGGTIEASYEPTILYPPRIAYILNYERGADVEYRYVDGVKTAIDLWPWPNEDIIKSYMCNEDDLGEIEDAINAKNGSSITYTPDWCASGKTLTTYVWEYLGNEIPADVYEAVPTHGSPTITAPDDFSTTTSLVEIEGTYTVDSELTVDTITWALGESSGFCVAALGVFSCTVPVDIGTNSVVFTVTDSNAGTGSDTTVVTRTVVPQASITNTSISHGVLMH